MTGNLVEIYAATSPNTRRRGRCWYPDTRRMLQGMAAQYERPLAQAVAVFAITSVDTTLWANLSMTEQVLRGERAAGRYPAHQAGLIRAALDSRYPGRYVRGPKCSAFYRAIMGDTGACVLDRWAARAAGVPDGVRWDGVLYRRRIEAAYREAAAACGETVRAFQAITWVHVRETVTTQRRKA